MPSLFTHPSVAISLVPWFEDLRKQKSIILTGVILTALPDLDVIGFKFGIPYGDIMGHRGITHSLFFAFLLSGLAARIISSMKNVSFKALWGYFSLCMVSHGILDAFTNGGHGIAFFGPFSNERYFFPFHPIEVSVLSLRRFFQGQGIDVIKSELIWVWFPALLIFTIGYLKNRRKA
jgi:inner membrane protein